MSLLNVRLAFAGAVVLGGLATMSQACTITTTSGTDTTGGFPGDDAGATDTGSSSDTGAVTDGSSGDAGLTTCQSCLNAQCQAQYNVCIQTSECLQIYQCAIAPACASNPTCVAACYTAHPAGQGEYYGLAQCNCGCKTECSLGTSCDPPADAGADATPPAVTCAACQDSKCAAEKANCASGTPCEAYTTCISGCTDSTCIQTCGSANPTGLTASTAFGQCTSDKCTSECNFGLRASSLRSALSN